MADGHHQNSTWCEQRRKARHCPSTLQLVKMHPHSREHDDIESLVAGAQASEVRQAVVNPFEGMRPMEFNAREAQRIRGFDGDDPVALRGKPCCIAASPGTHVEHSRRRRRQEVHDSRVLLGKRNRFEAFDQFCSVVRVALGSWNHGLSPPAEPGDVVACRVVARRRRSRHGVSPLSMTQKKARTKRALMGWSLMPTQGETKPSRYSDWRQRQVGRRFALLALFHETRPFWRWAKLQQALSRLRSPLRSPPAAARPGVERPSQEA